MKKILVYAVLLVLCTHTFGAFVGEAVHTISHILAGEHLELHSHGHAPQIQLLQPHVAGPGQRHAPFLDISGKKHVHEHSGITVFLLTAFSDADDRAPASDYALFNLFLLAVDGVVTTAPALHIAEIPVPSRQDNFSETSFFYAFFRQIPVPPPRLFLVS